MAISTGSDLMYNGKKIIGSAQFRKQNYILQHGSILLDINTEIISNIFNKKLTESNTITINQINPGLTNINILCDAIKSGFEKKFALKFTANYTPNLALLGNRNQY